MRIIAGKHKGRVLKEFKGRDIRPTSDRAKEALFNIFQYDISGSKFLDLFSGSGSVGIEALSRGASSVVFVDSAKESVELTKTNLSLIKETAEVYCSDGLTYLSSCGRKFDYIFIDPPYASAVGCESLKIIAKNNSLTACGVAIYEHKEDFNEEIEGLEKYDERRYGIAVFSFFRARKTEI